MYVWHVVQWVDRNSDALRLSLRHSNKHTHTHAHTHTAVKRHVSVSLHRGSEFLSGRLSLSSRGQSLSKKWTTLVPLQRGHQWRLPRQFVSCMCTHLDKYYKLGRVTAPWLTDVYHPKLFYSHNIFHVCCMICLWVIKPLHQVIHSALCHCFTILLTNPTHACARAHTNTPPPLPQTRLWEIFGKGSWPENMLLLLLLSLLCSIL